MVESVLLVPKRQILVNVKSKQGIDDCYDAVSRQSLGKLLYLLYTYSVYTLHSIIYFFLDIFLIHFKNKSRLTPKAVRAELPPFLA